MAISNSSNQFGISIFTVSPTPGRATYTTINAAVVAAATAGGGTVYIFPGTYNESIAFQNNVNLIAATTGSTSATSFDVIITGAQTFSVTGSCAFQGIQFTRASGDVWTLGHAGAGTSTVELEQCSIVATSGNGIVAASAAGVANLSIRDCLVTASANALSLANGTTAILDSNLLSTAGNCVNLGTAAVASCARTEVESSASYGVVLSAATSSWTSNACTYTTDLSAIRFTANATATTINDIFNSADPSTYYASASASFGTFNYSLNVIALTAGQIDPNLLSVSYDVKGSTPAPVAFNTTSASPQTISTFTVPVNSSVTVQGVINGMNAAFTDSTGGNFLVTAHNVGAGAVIVGSQIIQLNATSTGSFGFTVSGTDLLLNVTAPSAASYNWNTTSQAVTT